MQPATNKVNNDVIYFLGKAFNSMTRELGEPFGGYVLRGKDVFMFNRNTETISCEVSNGIVTSIETFKDRRKAVRIRPKHVMKAFLHRRAARNSATIIDISAKSIAMRIVDGDLPAKGEDITFCTGLKTRASSRTIIVLKGHVHRVSSSDKGVVILLHTPFVTHSHQALMDYICFQEAMASLGAAATLPHHCQEDVKSEIIIKSDLCGSCKERACTPEITKQVANDRG